MILKYKGLLIWRLIITTVGWMENTETIQDKQDVTEILVKAWLKYGKKEFEAIVKEARKKALATQKVEWFLKGEK